MDTEALAAILARTNFSLETDLAEASLGNRDLGHAA